MKKLIQLLNLYQEERKSKFKFSSYDHNSSAFIIEKSPKMVLGEETIISKKFGFIQWLVDNDRTLPINPLHGYSKTNRVIITLAVKDDPISFLVSVLK